MSQIVYADNAATTPLSRYALEAMIPFLKADTQPFPRFTRLEERQKRLLKSRGKGCRSAWRKGGGDFLYLLRNGIRQLGDQSAAEMMKEARAGTHIDGD
jgi:hypothetical protein